MQAAVPPPGPAVYRTLLLSLCVLLLTACSGEIYLRDGVTDGDTFYLAERALTDDDPVLQSWVSYSLMLSACKLALGDDNPARSSSFDCELTARRHLLQTWREHSEAGPDPYLDTLSLIQQDGWLPEYVATLLARDHWRLPEDLDRSGFDDYLQQYYPRHQAETRIIGSWNYARNVRASH